MEEIDQFLAELALLAAQRPEGSFPGIAVFESLQKSDEPRLQRLLEFQRQVVTEIEREYALAFVDGGCGWFEDFGKEDRLALITLAAEMDRRFDQNDLEKRLAPYKPSQPLFLAEPNLWSAVRQSGQRDSDLIDRRGVQLRSGSPIVRAGRHFAEIDFALPLELVAAAEAANSTGPYYVRLHPERVFTTPPMDRLDEAITRPIDPNWWRGFQVYRGELRGLRLALDPSTSPKENLRDYWEYHACGIRRWEMSVARPKPNYLTIMVEELEQESGRHNRVLGRCIHLDTSAPVGTSHSEVSVLHLDLAVNYYFAANGERRLAQHLDEGKVTDADLRTHLLRVEEVPFSFFFSAVSRFFRSDSLLDDWNDAHKLEKFD